MDNKDQAPDSPPAVVDPLIGKVLNQKFRIVSLIGRGGMGKIYKAEQLSLGRMVAIKLLSIADKTSEIEQFRERFYREASLCARLSHPNIVTIHDYGSVEGAVDETLWIAMEYLEGKTLMHRVKSNRQLAPPEAVAIVIEIARGIREAHKHGIVHRDLKCSNVMLVPDEDGGTRVKILDFGLVKSLTISDGDEALTVAGGGFLGSPGYMSPEQIQRGMPVDHRTDLYSLGVVLFRCLTGHNPFEGDQAQVLLAHVSHPPPTLKDAAPNIDAPFELEELVRRMLEKNPDKRVSSAEEVVRTLRDISEVYGWTKPTTAVYDNTSSFSKPQVLLLDPTPTTGGTIGPVAVSQTSAAKGTSKRRLLIAAMGVAGLAAALAIVLIRPRHTEPAFSTVAMPPAPVAAAAPPQAAKPPETQPTKTEPTKTESATTEPAKAEPALQSAVAAPAQPAPAVAAAPPAAPQHQPTKRFSVRPKAPPVAPAPAAAIAPRPAVAMVAPKPAPAAPPTTTAPAETGFLSLDTTPWSNVSEGGRSLGQTPLVRMKMSEGAHTLTMTTDHGTSKTFTVTIKAGQTVSKRLGLE